MVNYRDNVKFELNDTEIERFLSTQIPHKSIHAGVQCNSCHRRYLLYWKRNKFPMSQYETAECGCGLTIVDWGETRDLGMFLLGTVN